MLFTYVLPGWEGSAADSAIYDDARMRDFAIPAGKMYLADAGFGLRESCLVPFRGARYHLKEWGKASTQYVFPVL